MMKHLALTLTLGLAGISAQAATVAVVDSGTDFAHTKLAGQAWVNPGEIAGDRIDNDKNGKVDDVNGWNFLDGYGRVFVREHLKDINPIAYDLMRIIAHRQAGTVTPGEEDFYKINVTDLTEEQRQGLMAHLNYFGQYVHGTHCSGIVANQNPNAKILSARVFPDDVAPPYKTPGRPDLQGAVGPIDWIYRLLGFIANGQFAQVGVYLNQQNVDVANYSLGMGLPQIAKASLALRGKSNPTKEEIAAETQRLYAQFEPEGKKWMDAAPNTLFVVAAGNDGSDNDTLPAFPANVKADNKISVAASLAYGKIADFSNYGGTAVDVAAPGVAILSTVPSADFSATLPLSGTSMAAPFVAGVASLIKDTNPGLKPAQIREVLMGTVDKKEWLEGKVVSAGVVNPARAARAAELSKGRALDQAIAQARSEVADRPEGDQGPGMVPGYVEGSNPDLDAAAAQFVF